MNASNARWVPLREPGSLSTQTVEQRYGFGPGDDVEGFLNELREIGTRDHFPDWNVNTARELRRDASDTVDEILEIAKDVLSSLKMLRRKVRYFETHEYHPQIMRDVFAEDMNHPSEITLPDPLRYISGLLHPEEFWAEVTQKVSCVGKIELKRNPGPPSNDALAAAAQTCREFWKSRGIKGSIKFQTHVNHGDDVAIVDEPFERFCVDCLGAAGISFTLIELRTALAK